MRALTLAVVSVVCVAFVRKATLAGDGVEYFSMLESFWNHGTPEQRPEDVASLAALLGSHGFGVGGAHDGFFVTSGGRWYSYHFWIYPLLCVPAKALLQLVHADPFYAPSLTNAALLVATLAWCLRGREAPSLPRIILLGLATISPVLVYIAWPHGEVFTWCCVVLCLVSLDDHRFTQAATFAGLGALHAPPVVLLAGLAVALAWFLREPGRLRRVALAGLGASIALLSPLFYLVEFRVTNLIVTTGFADPRLISARRVFAFVFDLDQGMLPFAPAPLLLGLLGLSYAILARRWRALAVAATALAMLAVSSQTTNFNAGCAGMNRYDVWTMPLFAWLAAHELHLASSLRAWRTSACALVAIGTIGQAYLAYDSSPRDDAHEHHPLARFVLTHAPSLYTTEPEIFAERTLGRSLDPAWHGISEPIAFAGRYGAITKLLVDRHSLELLPERFDVDDQWLSDMRANHKNNHGLFFLAPPPCVVRPLGSRGHVVFAEGWYDRESLGKDEWRWMASRASILLHATRGAAEMVRLAGWVPEELGRSPTLTVSLDGSVIDRFPAPRQRFTRDYPLPAAQSAARITIETSDVVHPRGDDRSLGFALLRAELTDSPHAFGMPHVHFTGEGWAETFGERELQARCLDRPAELTIDPIPGARVATLVLGLWVPSNELGRPAKLRIAVDGELIERGPIHRHARRRIPLSPSVKHIVSIEPDEAFETSFGRVAACVDVLRYLPE